MKASKLLFLLLITLPAQAQVYSWVDDQGNRIYSDKNPGAEQTTSTVNTSNRVNYYSPAPSRQATGQQPAARTSQSALSLQAAAADAPASPSEADCQQQYGLSCERVLNWEQYAIEKCGSDDRCKDAGFLERKYKPVATRDRLKLANSAGARRNAQEKKLLKYLRNKYTDQCANQVEAYCARKANSGSCEDTMIRSCKDERSLEEMLARYNNLSPSQRNRVLAVADELSPVMDWEKANKILSDLVDLIVAGAAI